MLVDVLDEDEYKLVSGFIDSTDKDYVNVKIKEIKKKLLKKAKNKKQYQEVLDIPFYEHGKGLTIGNVCSQILSIFYLSKLDFYIIHNLKCKYMVRYCDDIVIFDYDKERLKDVFKRIELELVKYKLKINKNKSFIINIKNGFIFCGNFVKLDGKKTIIKRCKSSKNKIRRNIIKIKKMYKNGIISFRKYFCSINSYNKM